MIGFKNSLNCWNTEMKPCCSVNHSNKIFLLKFQNFVNAQATISDKRNNKRRSLL